MKPSLFVPAITVVLLLTGCNLPQPEVDRTREFTLSGPGPAMSSVDSTVVRSVRVAAHLDSSSMAVRVAENEVVYLDDIRWAEPLREGITQVLRARLGGIVSSCSVTVQVQRCELVRSNGNHVELNATYQIAPLNGDATGTKQGDFSATPRVWDGRDYGTLVAQMRDEIVELGDAIAAALPAKNPQ
jgi:uncharacterized lipoprotein YmbA